MLSASLRRYGIPDEILTDNGKVFTGRFGPQPTEVLFDRICRENGISHRHTAVRSPTTTGKIERFHRTLADGWAYARFYSSETDGDPLCLNGSTSTITTGPTPRSAARPSAGSTTCLDITPSQLSHPAASWTSTRPSRSLRCRSDVYI